MCSLSSTHDMIELSWDDDEEAVARDRARQLGRLRNSITRGRSNFYGMLGELLVARYVNGELHDTRDYDVMHPDGRRLEVKTKKTKLTRAPKPHFNASVCNHNTRQDCDAYVFVRISTRKRKAWICGCKDKSTFMREAHFLRKGDHDPSNNYTVHASCWNMPFSALDAL